MTAEPYITDSNVLTERGLWFGPLAGATAFSAAGFVDWVISARACYIGNGALGPISPGGVRWLLVAITVILFILALAGVSASYRYWQRTRRPSEPSEVVYAEAQEAAEFVSIVGTFASAALALGIIWIGLVFIFTDVCMREH